MQLHFARRGEDRDRIVLPLLIDGRDELLDGRLPHPGDPQDTAPSDDALRALLEPGRTVCLHDLLHLRRHAGKDHDIDRRHCSAQKPGAVPLGFSSTRAPTMKSACFSLQAGIGTRAARTAPASGRGRARCARGAPPSRSHRADGHVVSRRSEPAGREDVAGPIAAKSSSATTREGSSPTMDLRTTGMPTSSRRAESQREFVSWRSGPSISEPMATIAAAAPAAGPRSLRAFTTADRGGVGLFGEPGPLLDQGVQLSLFWPTSASKARAATGPSVRASSQNRVSIASTSASSPAIFSSRALMRRRRRAASLSSAGSACFAARGGFAGAGGAAGAGGGAAFGSAASGGSGRRRRSARASAVSV